MVLKPLKREQAEPETQIRRQATRHNCLHRLLGGGDKGSEIVCGEENIFCTAAKGE
jgi:hypothetical protein